MSNGPATTDFDRPGAAPPQAAGPNDPAFDEETYLRFNPDVRVAVAAGAFRSGREHYERYGRAEGRPYKMLDPQSRNRIIVTGTLRAAKEAPNAPACSIDTLKLSRGGGIYLIGWANDAADPLDSVDLYFASWSLSFDAASLARVRRDDAEAAIGGGGGHAYGFWGFMAGGMVLPGGQCSVVVRLRSGAEMGLVLQAEPVSDAELQAAVLAALPGTGIAAERAFKAAAGIGRFIGTQLGHFNKTASAGATAAPYAERYATAGRRYRGSIIVVLRDQPQAMFLQMARFAQQPGMRDYELIYVCNDSAQRDSLLSEARLCRLIYGLDHTLLLPNGDAGFAGACNLAAQIAASDRLIVLDPAALPRAPDWISRHDRLLAERPAAETTLFGVPLYDDSGALTHAGMDFRSDTMPGIGEATLAPVTLLRTIDHGRGVPPDPGYLRPRPVPAVSRAGLSVGKAWFGKLGGFATDYADGPYLDADFCLRSSQAGAAPWLHDLPLWHLGGAASADTPQREGGAIFNRWLLTHTWAPSLGRDHAAPPVTPPVTLPAEAPPREAPPAKLSARARKA